MPRVPASWDVIFIEWVIHIDSDSRGKSIFEARIDTMEAMSLSRLAAAALRRVSVRVGSLQTENQWKLTGGNPNATLRCLTQSWRLRHRSYRRAGFGLNANPIRECGFNARQFSGKNRPLIFEVIRGETLCELNPLDYDFVWVFRSEVRLFSVSEPLPGKCSFIVVRKVKTMQWHRKLRWIG